jgi:RNA polymerase sigma-70 factor (sigma-E family)
MGGSEEFAAFAAARSGPLFRTAWLLTGDWHLSEDLVQETLGRMYVRWGGLRRVEDPAAYAQTVLLRAFLTHRRRRSSSERPTAELPEAGAADDDHTLRLTLLAGLAQLDRMDRAVLVLRYWDDADVSTTASVLNISPGAVRMRSSRALERLRDVLGEDLRTMRTVPGATTDDEEQR